MIVIVIVVDSCYSRSRRSRNCAVVGFLVGEVLMIVIVIVVIVEVDVVEVVVSLVEVVVSLVEYIVGVDSRSSSIVQ